MHWEAPVLRLVTDPLVAPHARRIPRRARGLRRPRIAPRGAAARRTCGPSSDDLAARRRELVELGRLAVAWSRRAGPAPAQSAASVPKS
jgi:hypothetical protein